MEPLCSGIPIGDAWPAKDGSRERWCRRCEKGTIDPHFASVVTRTGIPGSSGLLARRPLYRDRFQSGRRGCVSHQSMARDTGGCRLGSVHCGFHGRASVIATAQAFFVSRPCTSRLCLGLDCTLGFSVRHRIHPGGGHCRPCCCGSNCPRHPEHKGAREAMS